MARGNHLAMKRLVLLFNEWEIQILVLVSFTIQFFLFFAGGLRRRTRNSILRSSIWLAYLGADLVAAYVLGLISRQEVSSHHLAFFWAPFLLIHLGGQDTITAFAIEDNTLWRRHLLNLVVQMSLTLYIFWKSFDGGPNMQLLAPSILLFVTGTIKYGERTWALWCGSLRNIWESDPSISRLETRIDSTSFDPVFSALSSVKAIRWIFTGIRYPAFNDWPDLQRELSITGIRYPAVNYWLDLHLEFSTKLFRIIEIQLSLMFDDIYTKALVIRTWACAILRCISHVSFLAAFVLFFSVTRNKEERWYYNSVDTAITYGLFFGGLFLEVSSLCIIMLSYWTWKWLKEKGCSFLDSIIASYSRKRRVLWSNSMGQYNMLNYLGQYDGQSSKRMSVIRKLAKVFCRTTKQKLWISKLVDTKFVEVDELIMICVIERIGLLHGSHGGSRTPQPQRWSNLVELLTCMENLGPISYHSSIIMLHLFTETIVIAVDSEFTYALLRVCRMISRYMVYLIVMHPEVLLIINSGQSDPMKEALLHAEFGRGHSIPWQVGKLMEIFHGANVNAIRAQAISLLQRTCDFPEAPSDECTREQALELQKVWVGLLLHTASKSQPGMHAAMLASGGELLTFIWLLMAHYGLGDVQNCPIEMTNNQKPIGQRQHHYAFYVPPHGSAETLVIETIPCHTFSWINMSSRLFFCCACSIK